MAHETTLLTRGQFAAAIGASLAALGLASGDRALGASRQSSGPVPDREIKADVALVFCDEKAASVKRIRLIETVITRACPRIKFTVSTVHDPREARDVVNRSSGVDGYLVWALGSRNESARVFMGVSKPVVLALDGAQYAA